MPENEFDPIQGHIEKNKERENLMLSELAKIRESLFFTPSDKLANLTKKIIAEPEKTLELINAWLTEGQSIIDHLPEEKKIPAQIGLIINQAEVLYMAGQPEIADEMIDEAISLAYDIEYGDLAQQLADL